MTTDTICAVATAIGEGSIGIIRISGEKAFAIGNALFRGVQGIPVSQMRSFQAAYGFIQEPTGEMVDECLLLTMHGPKTYTCEDVVEIQCHGSIAALQRILQLVIDQGARSAEPGEFTKRAFLNGRLDLAQAEAVMEIIRSRTTAALKASVGQLRGALSQPVRAAREELIALIAHLEATIDFPEEDIEELAVAEVKERVQMLQQQLAKLADAAHYGRLLREGIHTVIIGRPNVGKSSLLNSLLRESRAIVTAIPGTTRDVIEEQIHIKGIPLRLVDTAGIRETADVVEKIGVERSRRQMEEADLVLLLLDASEPLTEEDREILEILQDRPGLVIFNKSDLTAVLTPDSIQSFIPGKEILQISTVTGQGMEQLEDRLYTLVAGGEIAREGTFIASQRQSEALQRATAALAAAEQACAALMAPDFVVIDLRQAWHDLGEVLGETVAEDLLDQIFSRFCIGK